MFLKRKTARFRSVYEDSFRFVAHVRACMCIYLFVYIFSPADTELLSLLGPIAATWVALETWKFCCLWLLLLLVLLLDLLLCTCMRCLAYPACLLSPIYLFISLYSIYMVCVAPVISLSVRLYRLACRLVRCCSGLYV